LNMATLLRRTFERAMYDNVAAHLSFRRPSKLLRMWLATQAVDQL
jgi:hypothetical protein